MRSIRQKHRRLHRIAGRIYIIGGLIGALSGGVIGVLTPFGGLDGAGFNESVATLFFASFIAFTLIKAYLAVRQRDFSAHREWMIRSWALMLAIATERTFLIILNTTTDVDLSILFGTTFWMAGFVNIGAAEFWINYTRRLSDGRMHWKP